MDLDDVVFAHDALQGRRLAVHEESTYLRMRYAERLDRILERSGAGAGVGEELPAKLLRQERRELIVKTKLRCAHGAIRGQGRNYSTLVTAARRSSAASSS